MNKSNALAWIMGALALCGLGGCFWLFASRKRFSECSESIEQRLLELEALPEEWKTFRRGTERELEDQYSKWRTLAGRVDQQKSRERRRAEQEAVEAEAAKQAEGDGEAAETDAEILNRIYPSGR